MPRGKPNLPEAKAAAPAPVKAENTMSDLEKRVRPTRMLHVYQLDVAGDGKYREVAVVKFVRDENKRVRSIYYIDVALLDMVDKGRIKGIVTNQHADKYELWDLMSQTQLNNGKNALDYFHQLTRPLHGPGALVTQGSGLSGVAVEGNQIVGSEFTDTQSGALETQPIR